MAFGVAWQLISTMRAGFWAASSVRSPRSFSQGTPRSSLHTSWRKARQLQVTHKRTHAHTRACMHTRTGGSPRPGWQYGAVKHCHGGHPRNACTLCSSRSGRWIHEELNSHVQELQRGADWIDSLSISDERFSLTAASATHSQRQMSKFSDEIHRGTR